MPTITIAPKTIRSGIFESPSIKVPPQWRNLTYFKLLMNDADIQNASTHVEFDVYWSDNNIDWKYLCGFKADGLGYVPASPLIPDCDIFGYDLKGKWIKFKLTLNRSMPIGLGFTY